MVGFVYMMLYGPSKKLTKRFFLIFVDKAPPTCVLPHESSQIRSDGH
jgi:hypothetical protein